MRKTERVVISAEGRDKGKCFLLTEMSAMQAEKWAWRAFLAFAKSGIEIPDDVAKSGMAGIAIIGLQGLSQLSFDDAEPLLDEMFACISICPNTQNREITRSLVDEDIEEIGTRLHLRAEVLRLHTGFSLPGAPSTQTSETPAAPVVSKITRTSRAQ